MLENRKIIPLCGKIIEYSFYLLFILVPLIFTPFNFELFEFNKIWVVYLLTVVISASWFIKMVLEKRLKFQRTPLDIPLLLFLTANIASTILSIDTHTSVWGYYSRFNGGLLSITSYILLYFAFVNNFQILQVRRLLIISLIGGFLVAGFGVLEHFGIDSQYWVQDVKNRVFSTLGQPNWLAAYLSVLIPISIALGIQKIQNVHRFFRVFWVLLPLLFYLTLLFTKSRSGFLGLWVGLSFFLILFFWQNRQILKNTTLKIFVQSYWYLLVVLVLIGSITLWVGSPFEQLNRFTLSNFLRTPNSELQTGPVLEVGGTESGEIRKIVWQGALDIARAYPLFGSGVETFAYSYYKFRPIAHNLTSEWDFLYNKAHNEYLNYLATTGFLGLGAYLFIIGSFLASTVKQFKIQNLKFKITVQNSNCTLHFALVASYISILVSNFFGFSVTLVNLYFFLIPAFVFILANQLKAENVFVLTIPTTIPRLSKNLNVPKIGIISIVLIASYILITLLKFWLADVNYAAGFNFQRSGQVEKAYQNLRSAVDKRGDEPIFKDELAINSAILATLFYTQEQATEAASFTNEAIALSGEITQKHPNNVTFWKNQARLFYTLSGMSEKYLENTISSLEQAKRLAPTDPKISYNLALLYAATNQNEKVIAILEETVKLKPNYRDAHYALGIFYDENGERQKAIEQMDFVLKNIASTDAQATEKLLEWRGY